VYVYTTTGAQLFYDPLRVYKVRGLFEAGVHTDPANGVSLFRLRQAHVEEAVGAKIMKIEDTPASAR
jgi:2,3-bisphosphoglycerate-independent phosphoglycerate mutase